MCACIYTYIRLRFGERAWEKEFLSEMGNGKAQKVCDFRYAGGWTNKLSFVGYCLIEMPLMSGRLDTW